MFTFSIDPLVEGRLMGKGGGYPCYIILRGEMQNCYITLYGEGRCQKIDTFLLYNFMWTAPILPCSMWRCPHPTVNLSLTPTYRG